MKDVRQSSLYAQFMRKINWQVEKVDGVYIFIKKIPLFGSIIKIQRSDKLPDFKKIKHLVQKYRARSITFEPDLFYELRSMNYELISNPYLPTKTIHIDLTVSKEKIFNNFSSSKKRDALRSEKLGVKVKQSDNIQDFIHLKNKCSGFLGFLNTTTLKPLWKTFAPDNTAVLFASDSHQEKENVLAGVLILYANKIAYYWMAASTKQGNRFLAPTLLVWEALQLAKKKGCEIFDFEGIYDERYPKINKSWYGFTKFKQGFGGKEVYYPQPLKIRF